MSLIVGAYPAQPVELQEQFYRGLAAISPIRGLELPYGPHGGTGWPAGAPEAWSAVVTAIPGTMQRLAANAAFGLASADTAGRREALDFAAGVREYARGLQDAGHEVEAVELHSAPAGGASARWFEESLKEVLEWDWGSARVLIEHCDAPRPGARPEKGFLSFAEEVDIAVSLRNQGLERVGVTVNWARSVIESGSPETAVEHLSLGREAGVLEGLVFSGCSPEETGFGYAWIDAHLPAVEIQGAPPSSMLNRHEIDRCLAAAGPLPILGFKVGLGPDQLSPEERVERLRHMSVLVGE
ncbi:uncharacterized protein DUF4862 [Arthrobacter sp. AG258]|uniref:DUF4862 family protein n=1 Tax=Arthrobacter sp. AG258 TaxID=2183899 RepID=UPI00105C21B4|nr:DUF4862 family protein [Arthrobacter sp. AG258]TDT79362.1 uncharacterized protein DUF4862 [Arthrobacter sp. AG258]